MSDNSLMIPSKADVPAYVLNPELARQANEDAASGISTGFPARIKLNGKQFALVDGNGEEKAFPVSQQEVHKEVAYMPIIILRAKKALSKVWYATAFNPGEDGKQPDCFSDDSERPSALSLAPQAEVCAACPQNAFGSGTDQAGNATKGKACADNKIMAAFVPGFGVHQLKVPPASLKNFGLYVKQLSAAGIPLGNIKTLLGFDQNSSFPVIVFAFGGYLPEDTLPKVTAMIGSVEVDEIIGSVSAVALPPPAGADMAESPASIEAKRKAAEADAKAKAEAEEARKKAEAVEAAKVAAAVKAKEAAKKKAAAEAAAKPAAKEPAFNVDLDMGMGGPEDTAPPLEVAPVEATMGDVTDNMLRDELGL